VWYEAVNAVEDAQVYMHIASDPGMLGGKPLVRGTRLSVAFVLSALASIGADGLKEGYPFVTNGDIEACLRYAAFILETERGVRHAVSAQP